MSWQIGQTMQNFSQHAGTNCVKVTRLLHLLLHNFSFGFGGCAAVPVKVISASSLQILRAAVAGFYPDKSRHFIILTLKSRKLNGAAQPHRLATTHAREAH